MVVVLINAEKLGFSRGLRPWSQSQ